MLHQKSVFLLPEENRDLIYDKEAIRSIQKLTINDGNSYNREDILSSPSCFNDVQIAFSGWGSPVLDEEFLNALPSLEAYFYGAGSVRSFVTDAFWERDILLTSAYSANAIPVSEYTVAMTILSLKRVWHYNNEIKKGENCHDKKGIPGMYRGTKVGVISLGAIGRLVAKQLSAQNVEVFAFDPYAADFVFDDCGANHIDSLDWLFSNCDVVTLHAPWMPETEKIITFNHFQQMQPGSTFINTSRGMIVDECAMLKVLSDRPDVYAVLDVIQDESTYGENPLGKLPNVFLTPHISGSMGRECHRMGDYAVEECKRYLNGQPQHTPITRESMLRLA